MFFFSLKSMRLFYIFTFYFMHLRKLFNIFMRFICLCFRTALYCCNWVKISTNICIKNQHNWKNSSIQFHHSTDVAILLSNVTHTLTNARLPLYQNDGSLISTTRFQHTARWPLYSHDRRFINTTDALPTRQPHYKGDCRFTSTGSVSCPTTAIIRIE